MAVRKIVQSDVGFSVHLNLSDLQQIGSDYGFGFCEVTE